MSHFTVLAIGENYKEEMEPYWEVDLAWEDAIKDPRAEFQVEVAGASLDAAFEEWKEKDLASATKYNYLDAQAWVENWNGARYYHAENAWGSFSNPKAKWDWWSVGGRWTGFFPLQRQKVNIKGWEFSKEAEELPEHGLGTPGLMTEAGESGWADQVKVGDVDWARFYLDKVEKANTNWDKIQAELVDPGNQDRLNYVRWAYGHRDGDTLERYVQRRAQGPLTYAVLYKGEWIANGEMGWFGVSMDEDCSSYEEAFTKIMESLDDDDLLTILDCHI